MLTPALETRRYLSNFDADRTGHVFTDVLVIGAGAAGLRAAIEAAGRAQVLVVSKAPLPESNTHYAQGGIAAALDPADSIDSHVADTVEVGCGLGDVPAIRLLAEQAPRCIEELQAWGASFDGRADRPALGREAGHATARIVHAHGDATGREIAETLIRVARAAEPIRIFENCYVIDLLTHEGRCVGASTYHAKYGHQLIWSKCTVLATGGIGQLYRETTNPAVATGDGHAMAFRAGATLRDMEMVQFHPTTLYVAGASRSLISEAVRGEGAVLHDRTGHRFMPDYHPDAELAPRDVVSRAIIQQMVKTATTYVLLDLSPIGPERFVKRFPAITQLCREFGIDAPRAPIPVRPSAHYTLGGVRVGLDTRTSIPQLLACGEAASTGAHGANRLASNSLLEALVFGRIAGAAAIETAAAAGEMKRPREFRHTLPPSPRTPLDLPDVRNSLRSVMWRNAGIERTEARLAETLEIIEFWSRYLLDKVFDDVPGWEAQNLLTVGHLVVASALTRTESRGVHYRSDFPQPDPDRWLCHLQVQRRDGQIALETDPV